MSWHESGYKPKDIKEAMLLKVLENQGKISIYLSRLETFAMLVLGWCLGTVLYKLF